MRSLDQLDMIDWSELRHAYGEASDVPELLRRLTHEHWEERQDAYHRLIGTIWHQNDIYEATAAAVPFLIHLIGLDDVDDGPAQTSAAHYAGAILTLVARSACTPYGETANSDPRIRKKVCKAIARRADEMSAIRDRIMEESVADAPRAEALRFALRAATGEGSVDEDLFEVAYGGCETGA